MSATDDVVIVTDRDPADTMDTFRCLAAADGSERWTLRRLAPGNLDYGNSSRSAPLIHGGLVFLASAHGGLYAVEIASGAVRWEKDFRRDFGVTAELSWGFCSSPLVVDGKLIVNPGGSDASLVALATDTGEVLWKSPGGPPGHGSLIAATLGGRKQVIGHDKTSLGGWDAATGERLWRLEPQIRGDFNVPTPLIWRDRLVISTENNGTRMYRFDDAGRIVPNPVAQYARLAPDTHTPVIVGDRLFGASNGLHALDLTSDLQAVWTSDEFAFGEHTSLIAGPKSVLATTLRGELILFDAAADKFQPIARMQLFDDEEGLYSHPALVGRRLFVRGSKQIVCIELDE